MNLILKISFEMSSVIKSNSMQILRIIQLYFINIFQHRARMMVWFLIALLNPLLLILFWQGTGKSSASLISYYLLLIIAGALLMSHVEEDISDLDIRQGDLVGFLLKPYSYYWLHFFGEMTYRVLEGSYGIVTFIILSYFFSSTIVLTTNIAQIGIAILIMVCGYFIAFTYKMILGMIAFWTTDISGVFQVSDIVLITVGGFIMPISLMPEWIAHVAKILPFSYMIYYPIAAFSNQLSLVQEFQVLGIQLIWIVILGFLYRKVWSAGIKKFSGVGN